MIAATLALISFSPAHQTKADEVLDLLAQMPAWYGFPSIDERNEIVRIAEKLNTYRTVELREGMRLTWAADMPLRTVTPLTLGASALLSLAT